MFLKETKQKNKMISSFYLKIRLKVYEINEYLLSNPILLSLIQFTTLLNYFTRN